MVLAYDNGAKYIIIFDSDHNYTQNILKEEHLQAMNQFWQYTKNNPRTTSLPSERVASAFEDQTTRYGAYGK